MTSNDEPLRERRISLTEEKLNGNSNVPEELRNHTIKRLQKECRRKVNILLLLALFCSTGAGTSAYITYNQSKNHEAEIKQFEDSIKDNKKEAIKRENKLMNSLIKSDEALVASKKKSNTIFRLRNSQLRFIEDAVNCELQNRTFDKKGKCLQKAVRKRLRIKN